MARDLLLGTSSRDWNRGADSGEDKVVVVREGGMGFWGWAILISLGTRVFTGKWPWNYLKKTEVR